MDDIVIAYKKESEPSAETLIAGLKRAYKLHKQEDLKFFLGIQVIRDRPQRKIYLSHKAYINKMAHKYGIDLQSSFPSIPIPATEYPKHTKQATKQEIKLYQEKVGSLLYTAVIMRADIAFAASKLSQFLTNPEPKHIKAVD